MSNVISLEEWKRERRGAPKRRPRTITGGAAMKPGFVSLGAISAEIVRKLRE